MMLWLLLKFVLIWAKEINKLLNLVSTTFPFPKIVFQQLQEFYFRNVKYDILTEIYRCTEILMKICSFPVPLFFILGMNTEIYGWVTVNLRFPFKFEKIQSGRNPCSQVLEVLIWDEEAGLKKFSKFTGRQL